MGLADIVRKAVVASTFSFGLYVGGCASDEQPNNNAIPGVQEQKVVPPAPPPSSYRETVSGPLYGQGTTAREKCIPESVASGHFAATLDYFGLQNSEVETVERRGDMLYLNPKISQTDIVFDKVRSRFMQDFNTPRYVNSDSHGDAIIWLYQGPSVRCSVSLFRANSKVSIFVSYNP